MHRRTGVIGVGVGKHTQQLPTVVVDCYSGVLTRLDYTYMCPSYESYSDRSPVEVEPRLKRDDEASTVYLAIGGVDVDDFVDNKSRLGFGVIARRPGRYYCT